FPAPPRPKAHGAVRCAGSKRPALERAAGEQVLRAIGPTVGLEADVDGVAPGKTSRLGVDADQENTGPGAEAPVEGGELRGIERSGEREEHAPVLREAVRLTDQRSQLGDDAE